MPKAIELRKVIKILKPYQIEFHPNTGGKHSGKFIKGSQSFPVKTHGKKTMILPYALNGLIKKFGLPSDVFD
ncbi:hypothetical protein THIOM_002355 [Candidatus Thiomargarita nelsonii]|uniref:YcfA family protein n=1 Tax=Candidatus Thiomargarita nelsonii TaxID=1003181 RepID=A0A0A6NZ66_9GAMM|nr:hypothetical protein THIOM_002355 [Candidatus Thiomargarita nelsonii]